MRLLANTDRQQIVIDVLEDEIGNISIGGGSVTQAIAIVEIALNVASARARALRIQIGTSTGIDEQ